MIKYLLLPILFSSCFLNAQVGIGTAEPKQDLHIAGETSTIRIESLNTINNINNNGTDLAPVSIDGLGNYKLEPLLAEPIQFLIEEDDFIPNKPFANSDFNTGMVINSDLFNTSIEEKIQEYMFTMPRDGVVQVNYAVTILIAGRDLSSGNFTPIIDGKSRTAEIYFAVDIDSDGLDNDEASKKYGLKGQYYASIPGGIAGYAYMNSQGNLTLPMGTHTIHFFGIVKDGTNTVTSVGFGGTKDYLKIRLYN